jgi:hypothetical protein
MTADLDSHILRFSPQSAPPPPHARMAYLVEDDGICAHGANDTGSEAMFADLGHFSYSAI